jgi:hypothetical protein
MTESPTIIRLNIAHYEALLKLKRFSKQRGRIEQMLAEARAALSEALPAND